MCCSTGTASNAPQGGGNDTEARIAKASEQVTGYSEALTVLQDTTVVAMVLQQLRAPSNLRNGARWAGAESTRQAAALAGAELARVQLTYYVPYSPLLASSRHCVTAISVNPI